ncbi:MAG TPA: M1 family metallopeptidase [Myxococcales bacterium]|nr:M1 family metallopeptidase [Myxococcales bacterium]
MLALLLAVEVAGASAGAVRVPSSDRAFGGVREDGPEPVANYDLQATLDPVRHTVEGKERLSWKNRSAETISSLYVHLYLNAFEGPGSTFMQEKVRYGGFRTGVETKKGEWGFIELKQVTQAGRPVPWVFVHPDGGPGTDRTVARLDLPQPVPPGGTTVLEMEFHDQLPRVVARTGWFDTYHLVAQWFPKVGVLELPGERGATLPRWNCHEFHLHSEFYADFGSYRATLTVPRGYVLGSVGTEAAPPEQVAEGVRYRIAQDRVHDFAFAAWDGFQVLEGDYRAEQAGAPDVHIKVLHPAEYARAARIALDSTRDALAYFSRTLGAYPYRQVTVVVPPYNAMESGGMEYETFFTTVGALGPPLLDLVRFVTVHEFGHGYFMGLLASNEFEEPFLDEGLNEFWDARMLQGTPLQISAPGLLGWLGLRSPPLAWFDLERSGTRRFQADPIAGNSWDRWSRASYGLVYSRTALVFHDLEQRLGGDVLARGFREYYRRWRFRHPSTADLEEVLAEASGGTVREWFAEQVYGIAPVDDRIESIETRERVPEPGTSARPDGSRVEVDEGQARERERAGREAFRKAHPDARSGAPGPFPWESVVQARRYAAHVPQRLTVRFEGGEEQTLEWPAGERWHRWVFERPVRVSSAQLDADRSVLLDLDKLDDGRTREASPLASRRWTLELQSWAAVALSLLEGL